MKNNIKFINITFRIIFLMLISLHVVSEDEQQDAPTNLINLVELEIRDMNRNFFSQFGKLWKTEKFEAYFSPYNDANANGIVQISMTNTDDFAQALDEMIAHATTHAVSFSWIINPKKCPQEFNLILNNKGFTHERYDVMIYDLHNNKIDFVQEHNISIITRDEIISWLTTCNNIFEDNPYTPNFTPAYAHFMEKTIDNNNHIAEYYAGYINEKIVAIGTIFFYAHYGYIANIGTDSTHQNKGMATHILYALLASAQDKGLHHVFLLTNTAAKLYATIGFKKIFEVDFFTFHPNTK